MKKIIQFIKTTAIGGLIVIIPLAVIAFIVGDTVNALITAVKPYTVGLPFDVLTNTLIAVLIVIVIIVVICFAAGFLVNTFWGASIKNWLEKNVLEHVPMYSILRGLTQQMVGVEGADYPVVEADLYGSDSRVLGILIENLPDDRQMIYVPLSPVVTVGQLHILPGHRVSKTNLSMAETLSCISQMGLESSQLFKK